MANQFVLTMRVKELFFDRAVVRDRMSRANRRALSKAGAFIRRRARSSLRRRKKPSAAGQPPSVHTSDRVATLRNILFAYEPESESLVVGPVRLQRSTLLGPDLGNDTVPQIHEFGATVQVREVQVGRQWRLRAKRGQTTHQVRVRSVLYPERPFMGPALDAEREHIPDAWSGSMLG